MSMEPESGKLTSAGQTSRSMGTRSAGSSAPSANLFVRKRGQVSEIDHANQRPSISYWKDAYLRVKKNRFAVISFYYIAFITLMAVALPPMLPYTYDEQEIWNKDAPPNMGFDAVVVGDFIDYNITKLTDDQLKEVNTGHIVGDALAIPANVRVDGQPLTSGLVLKWDPVAGARGYRIWRSSSADSLGLPLADADYNANSYLDRASLRIGETYFYRVASYDDMNEGDPSPALEVSPKMALRVADALKFDANAQPGSAVKTWPHVFGTDGLGRDLLVRVLMGARISLFIGFGAPLIFIFIGIVYGCISGFFGGTIDNLMMRVADIVSTIPELLVVIMLQVMMGSGAVTLIVAMVLADWSRSARQIRGEVLRIREMEFIHAARILGTGFWKTMFRHLLPNVMGTVLVLFSLAIPAAIFTEAFLSFIGLGIAPPMSSWGTITREGSRVMSTYPHELMIPAIMICLTMLAFNLLGDGLRDALDPKLRGTT